MNSGVLKHCNGLALRAGRSVLLPIVIGLALAGCASKATQKADGSSSASARAAMERQAMEREAVERAAIERAAMEREALEGFDNPASAAEANPNSGVKGTLAKGFAGTWDSGAGDSLAGLPGSANSYAEGTSDNRSRDGEFAGNEWERELLANMDPDASIAEQIANRVAAARQHALDIARETEDATLYAAVTGGRDLYADIAEERALAASEFKDFDPNRDYQKRGFFDEEEYAFAPGMSDAERLAARVEGARHRAGLTDTSEEAVMAFAEGSTYSRIYDRDSDISGLVVADSNGNVIGWAAPGEVTADGTRFAEGASERMLGELTLAEGSRSGGSQGLSSHNGRNGFGKGRGGAIDVTASNANVNEEVIPQTLGGALPMVLGVDENGQFDFDAYLLRDEVKAKLDQLAQQLEDAEYDRLDVVGYTDRIGGDDYNRELSRKRALAVARYLRDRGVPEHKIMVTGKGKENPLTQYDECEGLQGGDKILCLQPDRRVEIGASIVRTNVEMR